VKGRVDRILLGAVLLLVAWGLVMVYSTGAAVGVFVLGRDAGYLASRQLVKAAAGILLMLLLSLVNPRILAGRLGMLPWAGSAVLLAILAGHRLASGGDGEVARWLPLFGAMVQPSEFARLGVVVALAALLSRAPRPPRWGDLWAPALLILGTAGLVAYQPNMSMASVVALTGLVMFWLAGVSVARMAPVLGLLAGLLFILKDSYQVQRLADYLRALPGLLSGNVLACPNEQVEQALVAMGSGGLVGPGVGRGLQKFLFLAEPHTDFILAVQGEETGFVGVVLLLGLEAVVVWRMLWIARRARDPFCRLLAAGVGVQLGILAGLHAAVNLGLGPTTGIPLPFVSFGGSALVANLVGAGLLLGVGRYAGGVEPTGPLDAGPVRWRLK
jgi:cell division protein FtsW